MSRSFRKILRQVILIFVWFPSIIIKFLNSEVLNTEASWCLGVDKCASELTSITCIKNKGYNTSLIFFQK